MAFVTRLRSITFSDGRDLPVPQTGVVVLVGPNNSGKSAALREIYRHVTGAPRYPQEPPPRVVTAVQFDKEGSEEELRAWLEENTHAFTQQSSGQRNYSRGTTRLTWNEASQQWLSHTGFGPALTAMFVMQAHTAERLQMIQPGQHWNPFEEGPSQPLQVMFAEEHLERDISAISMEAGWEPLHLSRLPGGPIDLYVGTPEAQPSATTIDPAYVEELRGMPRLVDQGDGMRSFIGIMLLLTTGVYPAILIDEPEAFLHPPQARLLGRKIASESDRTQVILATHDTDLLFGMLNERAENVTVVRVTRSHDVNPTSVLPPEDIARLWSDPLLAASNLLDGLFHRGVILCEGDTDARYYAAVLEAERGDRAHELFITHCGGKARLAMVTKALRALSVPVAVIADLDLLRERERVGDVVGALGGKWELFERDWRVLTASINAMTRAPAIDDVREAVNAALVGAAAAGTRLTVDASKMIRTATKVDDGWSLVKDAGIAAARQGDGAAAADALLSSLSELRLFLVPVGEVERFHTAIGDKSSGWLAEVLAQGVHAQEGQHRDFVRRIAESFDAT
jgi:uncharacterized Zn-binding protein involved in type VI secretion